MNAINNKSEVFNPILYQNTIGEELCEIFTTNNYSFDILTCLKNNIEEIKCITKLSKKEIKEITQKINNQLLYNYFINFQEDYKISKGKADAEFRVLKKIYSKIKHIESFVDEDFKDGIDKLEDISNFLEIDDEKNIFNEVNKNIALYKISNFKPDNFNLYSWLKKGEHDFKKKQISFYNKEKLQKWLDSEEWKNKINDPNYFLELPGIFNKFGVGLIYTPYLEKTVYGCVRWFDGVPLVQISDRGKSLATLWYVLFHELGHVIKHENDEIFEGSIEVSKSKINAKEKEANSFANSYLFGGDSLRRFIFAQKGQYIGDKNFIEHCSSRYNIHPILIAFWAQKAQLKGIYFNNYTTSISFSK
ncbi:ImmA/IrrE family metallo-endopeptidase [Elizabethkingia ursingii]|nr:ImmA/IrrE family metallo-endopeptidase [Elizabethkingia ursingii]